MKLAKLLKQSVIVGPIMGAMIAGAVLIGCSSGPAEGPESNRAAATQEVSERGEHGSRGAGGQETNQSGEGRESVGEHSDQGESRGEGGQHSEARERGGEASAANALARTDTFDEVRGGARLVLKFDDASNSFRGMVENTSDRVLTRVRVEIHLDNGAELGPTTPTDLGPGESLDIVLPSTPEPFNTWTTHAEIGSGEGGSGESGGEHGAEGESGNESGSAGGNESREAEMSSPVIPLDQTWTGVLGGIAVEASFEQATGTMHTTVRNTLNETLCFVQSEPHLKSGPNTVGELGPDVIGDLEPGQVVSTSISVDSEPGLSAVSFDGYVVHLEVFECGGPGPQPHSSEGGESSAEGESGKEHGGESDGEHGSRGEGGSGD